ncbi:unnamed protein product [Dovyalis caffra]|uniref:K-box domain-containing protein n=1 Tax=Dovyalis caffra TaxID=77055 RepID=A0AAV1QQF6_9ROSI|nr:unnamed protein product [Dovyalis caffra]
MFFYGYSMERILERYERYSYAERQLLANDDTESNGNWTLEYAKLKARVEVLQRNQRHFMGEELDSLSLKDLQNLEHQIDSALKHVKEKEKAIAQQAEWEQQNPVLDSPTILLPQPMQPLNIRSSHLARGIGDEEELPPIQHRANALLPAWMLRHLNE